MNTCRLFVAAFCCLTVVSGCSCDDGATTEGVAPVMEVTESGPDVTTVAGGGLAIAFGDVLVGQMKTVDLVIKNKGSFRLEVTKVAADPGTSTEFSWSIPGGIPLKLEPQTSKTVSFAYAPGGQGADAGAVVLSTNDPKNASFKIAMTGRGVQPDLEVCTPEKSQCNDDNKVQLTLEFGNVHLGEQAGPHTVTVANKGAYPLTVTEAVVVTCPWDKPDCAFADMIPPTVKEFDLAPAAIAGPFAAGQLTEVKVTYQPAQGGVTKSALRIVSDDADELVVWVLLTGTGIAPRICPNPPITIDFGSVTIGSSVTKEFTFSSCGTEPLDVTAIAFDAGVTPEFSWAEQPAATPFTLQPGATITLKVAYAPTNEGEDNGSIGIVSTDPNSPKGSVLLHGKGTKAPSCDMLVSPSAVDFGSVPINGFSNKVIDIQNIGDADCSITEIQGPTGSPAFTIPSPPPLPSTIVKGGVMSFAVQYKPAKVGSDTGALVVVSPTDPTRPQEPVTLNGKGATAPPCSFQADPAVLTFGAVPMGGKKDMKTKIYNFGTDECDVAGWSLTAGSDPSFKPSKAPFPFATLAPGKFIEVTVSLVPDKAGPLTGKLEVKGGTNPIIPSTKVDVTLNGSGLAAQMCITPATLDYGAVTVGGTKELGFTVTSCGTGTLAIRSIAFDPGNPVFTFTAPPGAPLTLAGGQSKTVTVRFKPTTAGPEFGRVRVSSNAPANPDGKVELRGNYTGTCPAVLVCSPNPINFSSVNIGQTAALAFTCVNHGADPMTIESVALATPSTDFKLSTQPLPASLQSGGQLRVEVGYTPAAAGTATNFVTVSSKFTSADCNDFTKLDVKVSGEGVVPNYPKCIPPKVFQPTLKWAWPKSGTTVTSPSFKHVFMTPIVINLTDDNGDGIVDENDIPDIVFLAYEGFAAGVENPGMLRAISGDDGHELWQVTDPKFRGNYETQVAAADINGDGFAEILMSKLVVSPAGSDGVTGKFITGNILAFTHDGQFLWESDAWHGPSTDIEDGSAIGIADLDHDGRPEIWRGSSVYDNTGRLLWEGTAGHGTMGHGEFAFAADLDGAGSMELVAGNTAYRADGTILWKAAVQDGISAPADFNLDGKPEVVILPSPGVMTIVNGQTGAILGQLPKSSNVNAIIPPVIADIDGDGVPEIGVIGTCSEPSSQNSQECFWGFAVDKNTLAITQLWQEIINDATLGGGCSGFDFNGDGQYEVLQNDEQWVNAYAGRAHTQIYHASRYSITGWEIPVVADVDNDSHAEIVLKQDSDQGIMVYGNVDNDWVATRRIWNQFGYHITNINENGTVPLFEVPNWTLYNNYLTQPPFCSH